MLDGKKIIDLRLIYGYSRRELAEKIEVSEQSIWQYENGVIQPKFETINNLKKIFNVKSNFFFNDKEVSNFTDENYIAYRNGDREKRSITKSESRYLDYVHDYISYFSSFLKNDMTNINKLRDELQTHITENNNFFDNNLIKKIAGIARKTLGVKNNRELLFKLELSGVNIIEKEIGDIQDAYSTWISTGEQAYIILNRQRGTLVRRNFNLAHELGHLLMHYRIDITALDKKEYDLVEKEANIFASEFLMPEEEFIRDINKISGLSNPKSYIKLKEKWSVSIMAMGMRVKGLDLITQSQYSYFFVLMHKYNYKVIEPLDDEMKIIKPGKIKGLCEFVLENKLVTLDEFLIEKAIETKHLSRVLSIDESVFNKYKESQQTFNFSTITK